MIRDRLIEFSLPVVGLLTAVLLLLQSQEPIREIPHRLPRPEYLGSEGCEMCHPSEFASWQSTYHRTMSRRPEEVAWDGTRGPKLPAVLDDGRFAFRLDRRGSAIVARGPNLHVAAQELYLVGERAKGDGEAKPTPAAVERALERVPQAERSLALITGSHHYLAFWLAEGPDRELRQLPFVYHLDEQKWAPRSEAFLEPPDAAPGVATWNSNCIQCHAVAGEPRETEWRDAPGALHVRFQSRVAELGIGCESCHGPGRAHAEHYRDPVSRLRDSAPPDSARLINPAKVDSKRGSAVCGQCHAYFVPEDEATFWETGYATFTPGEPLEASRQLLSPHTEPNDSPSISREQASIFWPDGTMRVGGREYAGLIASACYLRGEGERQLGCSSCHSMHDSDPNDQLTREAASSPDAPCKSCHSMSAQHSRHAPGSTGDSCVDCHMPKTTYALLTSIRSHRVAIPEPARLDVPSACALCHVDRPLAWFRPTEEADQADPTPLGIRRAIAGNAAERAIYAAALGSAETQATIAPALARALLERLSRDPYHAVRRIAERGLRELPPAPQPAGPPLDEGLFRKLESERDERDVVISE